MHSQVCIRSLLAVLEAAPEYIGGGRFSAPPKATVRAFGRIYASWALSQAFYRAGRHLAGEADLESFLVNQWEARWGQRDAANLQAQARCWDAGDISANPLYGGDLHHALAAIRAGVLLMPRETDLYFRVADNEHELPHLRHGNLRVIRSINGHRAGNPVGMLEELAFIREATREWLASSAGRA